MAARGANALTDAVHVCLFQPFPKGVLAVENELEIELMFYDTEIAGCLSSFLKLGAELDAERTLTLRRSAAHIVANLSKLDGEIRAYFDALARVANRVLAFVDDAPRR